MYEREQDINWLAVLLAAKNGNIRYYLPWMAYNFPKLSIALLASMGTKLPNVVSNEMMRRD